MSVHDLSRTEDDFVREEIGPAAGCCFVCGEEVQKIVVVWHGHRISGDPSIALHPACAKSLALHLAKDGVIADHIERGDSGAIGIFARSSAQ